MKKNQRILLASHGTPGARAAERLALGQARRGDRLQHLIVVPEFWKGMMGDDWLNNIMTREVFKDYMESTLEQEVRQEIRRLSREAKKRGIRYDFEMAFGKPEECLLARLKRGGYSLVVLGSLRLKGKPGYRSRMLTDKVLRAIKTPLLIAPPAA
jgi:nucleotide-binding universal stress UspA family protein